MLERRSRIDWIEDLVKDFSRDVVGRLRNHGASILRHKAIDEKGRIGELELSRDEEVDEEKSYLAFEQSYPVIRGGELAEEPTSVLRIWIFDRQNPTYIKALNGIAKVKRRIRRRDMISARQLMRNVQG